LEVRLARLSASPDPHRTRARSRLLRALGRQADARTEIEASVSASRDKLDWSSLMLLWRELGEIEIEEGKTEQALDTFGKGLKAADALGDKNARARALVDTAWAFALLGHIGQADEAATEAKVLGGEAVTGDPQSSERLAAIAMRLGNTAEAIPLYRKTESLYRASGDEAAQTRCALHAAYLAWRESGDGEQLSRMRPRVDAVDDPEVAMLLQLYESERALQRSDYSLCESNAIKAVKLADLRNIRRSAKIARVMAARCGRRNGNFETATRMATEAGAIVEEELIQVVGDVPRQELGFEAFLIYRLLFSLQVESGDEAQRLQKAFVTSERARARAHLDAVARNDLGNVASALPVSRALQRDTALAEERVKNLTKALLHTRNQEGVAQRHRDALWALEDIKQTKLRRNPLLSRIASPKAADLGTTQSQLIDGDTLLLSYFMTEDRPYVFAISRDDAVLEPLQPRHDVLLRLRFGP